MPINVIFLIIIILIIRATDPKAYYALGLWFSYKDCVTHNTLIKSEDISLFTPLVNLSLCLSYPLCGRPVCWGEKLGKSHDLWPTAGLTASLLNEVSSRGNEG